ncbi:hypothetical protein C7D73_30835, partial [Klebsiella pneumoniae]
VKGKRKVTERIVLCCAAGMSTSIAGEQMKAEALRAEAITRKGEAQSDRTNRTLLCRRHVDQHSW